MEHLKKLVRDVPDFPHAGILFRDVTPLLRDAGALREVVTAFAERFRGQVDAVAGIESRGFIFGAPLAVELGVGFVPVRKAGRLPAARISREYDLEYGTSVLEMHADAVRLGERVLVVDDLLATGGTARAASALVAELGGTVAAVAVVIELLFLQGRAALPGTEVHALLRY
ncbi:MAG TPA: adenine phosphoribosyltransferase [Longimicrobium sp.]